MTGMTAAFRNVQLARARAVSASLVLMVGGGWGSAAAVDIGLQTRAPVDGVSRDQGRAIDPIVIERLLEVSRLPPQSARSMTQLREGVMQGLAAEVFAGRLPVKRLTAIERLAERTYGDDVLLAPIRQALERGLRPGDAALLLTHLRSPLGQKTLDAEDATARDGGAGFARFVSTFPTLTDHEARLAAAVEMERALDFTEVVSRLGTDLQRAVLGGLSFSLPAHVRPGIDALMTKLDAEQATLAETMRLPMTNYLAFIYETLTLEELDALNVFVATPAARRFSAAIVAGMSGGMRRASIAFGDGLGRTLSTASLDAEI